jgi:hypothetical protein
VSVTLQPLPGNAAGAGGAALSASALLFTSADWANRQVITVRRTGGAPRPEGSRLATLCYWQMQIPSHRQCTEAACRRCAYLLTAIILHACTFQPAVRSRVGCQLQCDCCFVRCWQHKRPMGQRCVSAAREPNPGSATLAGAAPARLAPGAVLRFDLQLAVSRGERAGPAAAASMRAIFLGGARGAVAFATGVSGVAGVAVPSLPFFAAAPVRCRPCTVLQCGCRPVAPRPLACSLYLEKLQVVIEVVSGAEHTVYNTMRASAMRCIECADVCNFSCGRPLNVRLSAHGCKQCHHAVPATGPKRAAARAQLPSPSGLAVLRLQPAAELSANLLLCLAPDALRTALVAHYADGALVGCGRPHSIIYRVVYLLGALARRSSMPRRSCPVHRQHSL